MLNNDVVVVPDQSPLGSLVSLVLCIHMQGHPIEMKVLRELLSNLTGYFGEYGVEMKSIADALGIDIGIIVTLNLSYDLRRVRKIGGGQPQCPCFV